MKPIIHKEETPILDEGDLQFNAYEAFGREMSEDARNYLAEFIASKLLKLRNLAGLTQNQVATKISISQAQICDIESGKFIPSITTICSYCSSVGYNPIVFGLELLQNIKLPACPKSEHLIRFPN